MRDTAGATHGEGGRRSGRRSKREDGGGAKHTCILLSSPSSCSDRLQSPAASHCLANVSVRRPTPGVPTAHPNATASTTSCPFNSLVTARCVSSARTSTPGELSHHYRFRMHRKGLDMNRKPILSLPVRCRRSAALPQATQLLETGILGVGGRALTDGQV